MRTIFPLLLVAACAPFAAAFAPSCAPLGLRNTRAVSRQSTPAGVVGLRLSSTDPDSDGYIKLEPTKTSWTGWGNSASAQKVTPIKVDPSNPTKAVEQALKAARESENINKYLGGTESKTKAGISGDVELVSFEKGVAVLRLTGNFWHNRQVVFGDVGKYMQQCCPGVIVSVEIEDPLQLNGFAETSNAFKDAKKITDDDLRNLEAKGTNMYGEKLEGPAAEFRRKKLDADAKYKEEMAKRKELDGQNQGDQINAILAEKGLGDMFTGGGEGSSNKELRPEDILASML